MFSLTDLTNNLQFSPRRTRLVCCAIARVALSKRHHWAADLGEKMADADQNTLDRMLSENHNFRNYRRVPALAGECLSPSPCVGRSAYRAKKKPRSAPHAAIRQIIEDMHSQNLLLPGTPVSLDEDGRVVPYGQGPRIGYLMSSIDDTGRCVVQLSGSPSSSVTQRGLTGREFQHQWRTPTVVNVARSIYEENLWWDFPILGDALEESGCEKKSILDHCRRTERHYRGDWLTDLILEKEAV